MDRNTLLAIVLSLAVLVGWSLYQAQFEPPPGSVRNGEPATEQAAAPAAEPPPSEPAPTTSLAPVAEAPAEPAAPTAPEETFALEMPLYTAEFTSRGAALLRWQLREYHHGTDRNGEPIVLSDEGDPVVPTLLTPFPGLGIGDLSQAVFEIESRDPANIRFRYSRDGVTVRKSYHLDQDSYSLRLRLEVENRSAAPVQPSFPVQWPASKRRGQEFRDEAFVLLHEGSVEQFPIKGLGSAGFLGSLFGRSGDETPRFSGEVDWVGMQTTYFLGVLLPDNPARAVATVETTVPGESGVASVSFPEVVLPPGQSTDQEFRGYLGPKEPARLEAMGGETVRSIDLGYSWIRPLVVGFGWLLQALYSLIPNYGLAIILLTILVRVVTMPLTNRQMRSMERMRELQPKVKELQEKYADDRPKQSEEMMKLYRSEGVNPLGGCFPMLLQLPVFIGLFYALRSSIHLRQAPFVGWINDLSAPETLFTLPGIDLPVRLLPLIMGVSMVLQQKLTPQPATDPAQARMMMTIMPIMMTVLFYQFPSGLVLYWFVSNILAIAHQRLVGARMRGGS